MEIRIAMALVFAAAMLLFIGGWLLWRSAHGGAARKLSQRLARLTGSDAGHGKSLLKEDSQGASARWRPGLLKMQHVRALQKLLRQAGLDWSLSRLALYCLCAAGLCGVMTGVLLRLWWSGALLMSVVGAMLPLGFLLWRRQRRLRQMELQIPDALDILVRALRAGHAFASGLQMMAEEAPEPLAGEIRSAHDEITFGISMQQALITLSERVPLPDLRYFVVAVLVQRESGGNLTEVLSKLSQLIRERQKLHAKVRVLSAEGRLSAWILGLMPFFLAGAMFLVNREFMAPLWEDPLGISMIQFTLGLMLVGVLILSRIVRIRV
jgi:tight adherence protein B